MQRRARIQGKITKFINSIPKLVWYIFGIGLVLRLCGIWFGLPLQLNMDEPTLVSSVLMLKTSLNPGHFDWPHLYFYINGAFYAVYYLVKLVLEALFSVSFADSITPFYLISRSLTAVLGSLSVVGIFILTRNMFSERIGVIASLMLSLLPIHVYESHLAKIDVAQTFFGILTVVFIYNIFKNPSLKNYILSGVLIGLTTSIKYNGFLLFIPLLIAHLYSLKSYKEIINLVKFKNLSLSVLTAIIAFFVGTPFALIDFKTFFSDKYAIGVLWQFSNVGSVLWEDYSVSLYETFINMYRQDLGLGLWSLLILLSLLYLFFNKRSKELNFLMAPFIFISAYISRLERSPSHYFLLLIPFYIPALAFFVDEMISKFKKYSTKLPLIVLLILLLPSAVLSFDYAIRYVRSDTRYMAYQWVHNNLDEDKDFLYVHGELLSFIPFQKKNTERIDKVDKNNVNGNTPLYIVIGIDGLTKEDITTGDFDPKALKGDNKAILDDAELLFYTDNKLRFGPPMYVLKINNLDYSKKDK